MNANKEVINDESQDSFLISLTSLDKLANKYGSNSSKVIKAAELLEDFVSVVSNFHLIQKLKLKEIFLSVSIP